MAAKSTQKVVSIEAKNLEARKKDPKRHHAPFCTNCGSEEIKYRFINAYNTGVEIDEMLTLDMAAGFLTDYLVILSNTAGDDGGTPGRREIVARVSADLHTMMVTRDERDES